MSAKLNKVISKTKGLKRLVKDLPIGYADWVQQCWGHKQMKLADEEDTRYTSQHFTKNTRTGFFACLSYLFVWCLCFYKSKCIQEVKYVICFLVR